MIKHHPKFELLQNFVNGDLPASLSAGIAIHADMCKDCQKVIAQLTEEVAEMSFEQAHLDKFIINEESDLDSISAIDFDAMIDNITESDDIAPAASTEQATVTFNGKNYVLPNAIKNVELGKTANIGKLSRARLQLNEGEIHSSLLDIQPGGSVPQHTHNGFELTVLLEGSFSDERGEYVKGDFIMLDGKHTHQPISENGCLCYTVANDSLHFTQGINKLLNPIGSLIY